VEGDAAAVLASLAAGGERFDAFLLGDVLEHTADPVAVLAAAREAASPDAVLVASVPNVGHVSVVRDLVLGRFDPVPAGLMDAGHLRWFTRQSLEDALDEAGWKVETIEGSTGATAPASASFRSSLAALESETSALDVYQWIAVARPRTDRT
jgi:2-polyprenyl-3-methyl-5-hydroxy-6-metoxy-1,4-benzoquinol methylase